MAILGLILLVLGLLLAMKVLFWIGVVLLLVGLFANFVPPNDGGPRRRVW